MARDFKIYLSKAKVLKYVRDVHLVSIASDQNNTEYDKGADQQLVESI